MKKTTGPAELGNNQSRKYRMAEVCSKANDKKHAVSPYSECGGSDWKCYFHITFLVLGTKTAFLLFFFFNLMCCLYLFLSFMFHSHI